MNNEDFIKREAALTLANTDFLYGTVLSIDPTNYQSIKALAEEVVTVIQDNTGEKFINFIATTNLAIPTVVLEVAKLQAEAKA